MTHNPMDLSGMTNRKPWHGRTGRRRLGTGVVAACGFAVSAVVCFADASPPAAGDERFVDVQTIHSDLASVTHDSRWTEAGHTGALCHALFDVAARARAASTSAETMIMTGWYTDTVDRGAVAGAFIAAAVGTSLPTNERINIGLTSDERWADPAQRGPLCRVLFETRGVMPGHV